MRITIMSRGRRSMCGRPVIGLALLVSLHGALHEPANYVRLTDAAHAARATWGKIKGEDPRHHAALPILLAVMVAGPPVITVSGSQPAPFPTAPRRVRPGPTPDIRPRAPPSRPEPNHIHLIHA